MNDNNSELVPVSGDDYAPQLKNFESNFLEFVQSYGLPVQDIFVPVKQRVTLFQNVPNVLDLVSPQQKSESFYISKFLAASAAGLFDAALNYLWDETIQELRKRAIQYDIGYLYDNAVHEEKRRKLKGAEDIDKIDDSELIQGARNIGLISELGYKHLDFIRYMRNWASAAHPNNNEITGLQLIGWLETCIKEVISLPLSHVAIEIKKLLANIKTNDISREEASAISNFFVELSDREVDNLASGFSGIYVDPETRPETRQNINYLLPRLWERVGERVKESFGVKLGKFTANSEQERAGYARQFLEIVNGQSYIPDGLRAAEIGSSIDELLSAHRAFNNFYSEPPYARQLAQLIGSSGKIPVQVQHRYVLSLVEVYITNGSGVAWNAEPTYEELIRKFDQSQCQLVLLSVEDERISSKLQFDLCTKKYRELVDLIFGKLTSPPTIDLANSIKTFPASFDKIRKDTRMQRLINAIRPTA